MSGVQHIVVNDEEGGMRLDRWFGLHYPVVGFVALQKFLRTGQVRLNGGRIRSNVRIFSGQIIRVPPLVSIRNPDALPQPLAQRESDHALLQRMLIHEDEHVFIFNKISGLAVQGGSGISRHLDDMLQIWCDRKGTKPRLVHRLDRETSGVLVVARTRFAAMKLSEVFRKRKARKIYWSLVQGVPKKQQSKISTWLLKEKTPDKDRVRLAQHGERGAEHAVSFFHIVEKVPGSLAWLHMEPYTGRTHQLRVHATFTGTPIVGDKKYPQEKPVLELPRGIQNLLHLHARRIILPHPADDKVMIDIKAPMPAHMKQSWNVLGFDEKEGDSLSI